MADTATISAAIIAGASAIGGCCRWGLGVLAKSNDNLATVIVANTSMLTKVAELLGRVDVRTETAHDRLVEIHDEISANHEIPVPSSPRKAAPAGTTYQYVRPKSEPQR